MCDVLRITNVTQFLKTSQKEQPKNKDKKII